MSTTDGELDRRLAEYRTLRHDLEQAIAPMATSVDGRRFEFQASLHGLALQAGGYVDLGEGKLGQVITLEAATAEGPDLAVSLEEGAEARSRIDPPPRARGGSRARGRRHPVPRRAGPPGLA